MNDATPQQLPSVDTRTSSVDPVIESESSDTIAHLPRHELTLGGRTLGGRWLDQPPSMGHRPRLPPAASGGPVQLLAPSPLIRSASAPPDYVPSPSASRQHRATRSHWPLTPDDDFRVFPMPPEVVETGRRPKECSACCLRCIVVMTTLRWLFVSAALLGAACVVTGIVFGVMSSTIYKDAFFILAFTFIGLGIVLVLVVGIGWRCSPPGHEPCHALCHLTQTPSGGGGTTAYDTGTQRATRLMHRSRNQWYAGFLYPEFHYATPPPSYSTSMQQYRQQVVSNGTADGDRSILGNSSISSLGNLSSLPSSPPPTYRSRTVGRVRPPLSGVMTLSGATTSAELPPPYQNSSTASSLDRLADAEEYEAPGTSDPALATPGHLEATDNDQHLVSGLSSHSQEGDVALEPLATPTTHVINETNHVINETTHVINETIHVINEKTNVIKQTTVAIIAIMPSSVPNETPEVMPSVRNIVRRFEDLVKDLRTVDISEKIGQSTSANDHPFDSHSPSDAIESKDLEADQSFNDRVQLRIQQCSFKSSPADQSHSRNSEDADELCFVSQSLKTSCSNNQSNVRISFESSCSSAQSSITHSDNDQSHIRISFSDVDSYSMNQLPLNPSTHNQRSTTTTNGFGIVSQSEPTSSNNVPNDVWQSEAVNDACVYGQSTDSRPIQILQPANHFQESSSSNQSHRDFSRSQSLDDPEIGESGI